MHAYVQGLLITFKYKILLIINRELQDETFVFSKMTLLLNLGIFFGSKVYEKANIVINDITYQLPEINNEESDKIEESETTSSNVSEDESDHLNKETKWFKFSKEAQIQNNSDDKETISVTEEISENDISETSDEQHIEHDSSLIQSTEVDNKEEFLQKKIIDKIKEKSNNIYESLERNVRQKLKNNIKENTYIDAKQYSVYDIIKINSVLKTLKEDWICLFQECCNLTHTTNRRVDDKDLKRQLLKCGSDIVSYIEIIRLWSSVGAFIPEDQDLLNCQIEILKYLKKIYGDNLSKELTQLIQKNISDGFYKVDTMPDFPMISQNLINKETNENDDDDEIVDAGVTMNNYNLYNNNNYEANESSDFKAEILMSQYKNKAFINNDEENLDTGLMMRQDDDDIRDILKMDVECAFVTEEIDKEFSSKLKDSNEDYDDKLDIFQINNDNIEIPKNVKAEFGKNQQSIGYNSKKKGRNFRKAGKSNDKQFELIFGGEMDDEYDYDDDTIRENDIQAEGNLDIDDFDMKNEKSDLSKIYKNSAPLQYLMILQFKL